MRIGTLSGGNHRLAWDASNGIRNRGLEKRQRAALLDFLCFRQSQPEYPSDNFQERTLGLLRGSISESRYKDAEAAKKSIAEIGHYLTGGEQAFKTTEPQMNSGSLRSGLRVSETAATMHLARTAATR